MKLDHIAFVVKDPGKTAEALVKIFDASLLPEEEGPPEIKLDINGTCVVLAKGASPSERLDFHVAFECDSSRFERSKEILDQTGLEYQCTRNNSSIYFVDFDNYLFEINFV